jgi:hypothetical protein
MRLESTAAAKDANTVSKSHFISCGVVGTRRNDEAAN